MRDFTCTQCGERMSDLYWCAGSRCAWCAGKLPRAGETQRAPAPAPRVDDGARTSWLVERPPRRRPPRRKLTKREKRGRRGASPEKPTETPSAPSAPPPMRCPRCQAPMRPATESYRTDRPELRCAECPARWTPLSATEIEQLALGTDAGLACPGCHAPMLSAAGHGEDAAVCPSCRRLLI